MKRNTLFFASVLLLIIFISSCNQPQKEEKVFGELDREAIAADTTMQTNIEASYEYVKDHPFKGNRIFSIINGGYTGFKDAIVAEKISMTDLDTIIILKLHNELITNTFLTDFDNNSSPEIHIITRPKGEKYFINYILIQNGKKWSTQKVSLEKMMDGYEQDEKWSINENSLLLEFPNTTALRRIHFKLKNNRFVTEKSDSIFK